MEMFVWVQTVQTIEPATLARTQPPITPKDPCSSRFSISFVLCFAPVTMRFAPLIAGLATLVSSVSATALTYKLEAHEKACFYANVDSSNAKVAFYFAVSVLYGSNS